MSKKEKKKEKNEQKGKTMLDILKANGQVYPLESGDASDPLFVSHQEFQELMKRLETGERLNMAEKVKIRAHLMECESCPVSREAADNFEV